MRLQKILLLPKRIPRLSCLVGPRSETSAVRDRMSGKRRGPEGTHCPHAQGVAISVEGGEVLAEFLAACALVQ